MNAKPDYIAEGNLAATTCRAFSLADSKWGQKNGSLYLLPPICCQLFFPLGTEGAAGRTHVAARNQQARPTESTVNPTSKHVRYLHQGSLRVSLFQSAVFKLASRSLHHHRDASAGSRRCSAWRLSRPWPSGRRPSACSRRCRHRARLADEPWLEHPECRPR